MAGKARNVDRSKVISVQFTFAEGDGVEVLMAGDGSFLGTILNIDALDRKMLERYIGGRDVVSVGVAEDDEPAPKKK